MKAWQGITLAVASVLSLIMAIAFTTKVDATEHCVLTRFGKITEEAMATGLHLTVFSKATCFTLTDRNYPANASGDTEANRESLEAQTADPITIQGDVAIVYAFDPTSVPTVFRAKRTQGAVELEIQNAIREGYRSALAGWYVNEIFSEKRVQLADSVRSHIQNKIGNRAIIKNVFVRSIKAPETIETARVDAARQAQILDKAQKDKEIAQAEADAAIARAQGEAEANRLRAQSYSSNPKLLDLEIAKQLKEICGSATTCVLGGTTVDMLPFRK